MKTFLVSYGHQGARWNIHIKAENWDDARERVARLAFASLDGEHIMSIPAAGGRIARAAVALRNWRATA